MENLNRNENKFEKANIKDENSLDTAAVRNTTFEENLSTDFDNIYKQDQKIVPKRNMHNPSDLCTIEYINLIEPEETYTIKTFNFKVLESLKNKKVAKKGTHNTSKSFISDKIFPANNNINYSENENKIKDKNGVGKVNVRKKTVHSNLERNKCYIKWVNDVDDQTLPKWKYVDNSVLFDELIIEYIKTSEKLNLGCGCEGECADFNRCSCSLLNFVYNKNLTYCYELVKKEQKLNKKLVMHFESRHHIFECNRRCRCIRQKCHSSYLNCLESQQTENLDKFIIKRVRKTRVVKDVTVTKVMWGLFTTIDIPKSTYVLEYCGEIITNREAEKRGKVYDLEELSYLFDISSDSEHFMETYRFYCRKFGKNLDKMHARIGLNLEEDFPLVIDAKEYGNVARFINHSCNPNLIAVNVHKTLQDPRFSAISLFATKDIKKGSELTVDYYYDSFEGAQDVYCLCGQTKCRDFLYSNPLKKN